MTGEERDSKEGKTKSAGPCPTEHMMFEMMKKCCPGEEAFSDCSTMVKGMMETMRSHPCCAPKAKDAEPEEGKK